MLTLAQIEALSAEASEHGDMTTVALCAIALDGDLTEEQFANVPDEDCDMISAQTKETARAQCASIIVKGQP